jgi:hypothetical protein
MGAIANFSLDLAEQSNDYILVAARAPLSIQPAQIDQQAFAFSRGYHIACHGICVEHNPTVSFPWACRSLVSNVRFFKDSEHEGLANGLIGSPVLAHAPFQAFHETVKPK